MNAKTTPMMHQYLQIKNQYPEAILMFRLGDFYEMFGEDAKKASALLEIVLTSRETGNGVRLPMCGVPHHSADAYIARLLNCGLKVAIAEQTEDPASARGLVARDVVRVITPGTNLDMANLESDRNNYILGVVAAGENLGIAVMDVSTGEFHAGELTGPARDAVAREIERLSPSELIIASDPADESWAPLAEKFPETKFTWRDNIFDPAYHADRLCRHFGTPSLSGFGIDDLPLGVTAASLLLDYVQDNLKAVPAHISGVSRYAPQEWMYLDPATRRNLELTATLRGGDKKGSLLWVLDRTLTPMGKRLVRRWVERPLVDPASIDRRLDGVRELIEKRDARDTIAEHLREVRDLERLSSRIATGLITPKELLAVRDSLSHFDPLKEVCAALRSEIFRGIDVSLDPMEDIRQLLVDAISDDAPRTSREGGIIRDGFNPEVDDLREIRRGGRNWVADLEDAERARTGIKSLKIGFNKVFGYYIEVTKANLHLVPQDYIRKQTTSNGERFYTPDLKEKEMSILGAEGKLNDLEYKLFCDVRDRIAGEIHRILRAAGAVSTLDVLLSFAVVAGEYHYTRPLVNASDAVRIAEGRHPVLDRIMPPHAFIPNDTALDCSANQVHIITGPNMAGKSTYMRQVALITLMAQIGCYVPAASAEIGVVDRIFTRVGAVDDIALGLSTFMVEMIETSVILHNASRRSLILLDEVGRGTSTVDGVGIAWAVAEFIHNRIGAKTLFATHFNELTAMEASYPRIRNFHVSAREKGADILFTHKLCAGSTDRSFGVEVAKLAGIPQDVVARAAEIMNTNGRGAAVVPAPPPGPIQLTLLSPVVESRVEAALKGIDPDALTPKKALDTLYSLIDLMNQPEN